MHFVELHKNYSADCIIRRSKNGLYKVTIKLYKISARRSYEGAFDFHTFRNAEYNDKDRYFHLSKERVICIE